MRVSLLVGTTLYPLAGEYGVSERVHSSAADWKHGANIAAQDISRVRASHSADTDRGNLKHEVTFSTTRQFDTYADAALYDLDYDRTMPRSGILVMDAVQPDGGTYHRHMAGALVYPPQRSLVGCTLFLNYRVTGGAITDEGYTSPSATAATGTFTVAASIGYYEFEIGIYGSAEYFATEAPSVAAARIAAAINADTFLAVTAAAVGDVVTLTAKVPGAAGNSITITAISFGLTASGATLTGGTD